MRRFLEEIKDFPKKGDTFLLVMCLLISGFGLVCIASATTAEKFDGNFRYIALQSFAVLMGAAAYVFISYVDEHVLNLFPPAVSCISEVTSLWVDAVRGK